MTASAPLNPPPDSRHVILDGALIPAASARISALGDGFLFGLGLFETIKVLAGHPVFHREHFARLGAGAAALGLPLPASPAELLAHCRQCIEANRLADGALKVVVFQDDGRVGELIVPRTTRYGAEVYARGFRLHTVPTHRAGPLAALKSLNYLECLRAKQAAQALGCDEALLTDPAGTVLEGSTSNVFMVRDGLVHTPPLGLGILPGIVRAQVRQLLPRDQVRESAISRAQLLAAEEVFVTNSLLGVMPVARLDDHEFSLSSNPVTRSVRAAFQAREQQACAGQA
ncbi:MAG: aminotransferase class IV [Opitutales bacterium]